jgi:hypothetical protein
MSVQPPPRQGDFLGRMVEIAEEIKWWEEHPDETPPMRLAGCSDVVHGPCPFLAVCHGSREPAVPDRYGFVQRDGNAHNADRTESVCGTGTS